MSVLMTCGSLVFFPTTILVLGAAFAPRWQCPLTSWLVGIILLLATCFFGAFAGFTCGASNSSTTAAVGLGMVAMLVARRDALSRLWGAAELRDFFLAWLMFAAWALGLLALVQSYSGGRWAVDWLEHWQRTVFFLERQPLDTRFGAIYALTARPPLANVVIALWLEATNRTFADYQVLMTLFGSLILLPAWLLTRRWTKSPTALWWLVLVLMLSPLVAQNLTFSWTKMPTAFFVLSAIALLVADDGGTFRLRRLAALCFGLALLTHYSAGPWLIAVVLAVFVVHRRFQLWPGSWREFLSCGAIIVACLALWLGWAIAHFGWRGTFDTNTTVGSWRQQTPTERAITPLQNLFATLVPFPLRGEPDDGAILQRSRLGRVRDVAFNTYQVTLPLAFGLSGIWVLAWRARRCARSAHRDSKPVPSANATKLFFWVLVPTIIVLGVLVHTPPEPWGLVHICLQPLVLLGLAGIAATLPNAPAGSRIAWAMLAFVDLTAGIVLHFGLQSGALARFVAPGGTKADFLHALNHTAWVNANDKAYFHLEFFSDRLHLPITVIVMWLVLCLALVIYQAHPFRCERP